jgi:glycosyltransferase involved in cell wall biosynthesis
VKILHLATSIQGGAGIAALRGHNALLSNGIESALLSTKTDSSKSAEEVYSLDRSKFSETLSSGVTLAQRLLVQNSEDLLTPFSLGRDVFSTKLFSEAQIVHIHAFYNFLSLDTMEKMIDSTKKIFITLHDERMFTGGCHYSRKCNNFISSCQKCPQSTKFGQWLISRNHQRSIEIFSSSNNVHFIAPSIWIKEKALRSRALRDCKIDVVRNPIPEVYFNSATDKDIKKQRISIGFVSQNIENPYKGVDILISAMQILPSELLKNVDLYLIGNTKTVYTNELFSIKQIFVEHDQDMANILQKIDLVVIPSTEDNFPSVIGECLASGTRVIGSNVGGIAEAMDVFSLPSFKANDVNELARLIEFEISKPTRAIDLDKAHQEFSEKVYAQRMGKLYTE